MLRITLLLTFISIVGAAEVPQYHQAHPGLRWEGPSPPPVALAGRVQLLLFHRNDARDDRWYGTLKKQLKESYSNDHRLVIIEVGEGETRVRANQHWQWFAANDPQRQVARALLRPGEPNRFLLLGPQGEVLAQGNAGDHRRRPDGWLFHLAHGDVVQQALAQAKPLVSDPRVHAGVAREVIEHALRGDYSAAFAAARTAPDDDNTQAVARHLLSELQAQVARDAALAENSTQESPQRWRAFVRLHSVIAAAPGSPAAEEAQQALRQLPQDGVLDGERRAMEAWLRLHQHLERLPTRQAGEAPTIRRDGLQQIHQAFPKSTAGLWSEAGLQQR